MLQNQHIMDVKKQAIRQDIHRLFDLVASSLSRASEALAGKAEADSAGVLVEDGEINALHQAIEAGCFVGIASHQPVATDLREFIAYMRIAAELERIGDFAVNIAQDCQKIGSAEFRQLPGESITEMAGVCRSLLEAIQHNFVDMDSRLARETAARDDLLDDRLETIIQATLEQMQGSAALVRSGSLLIRIAHCLERCGDHITNIAEQIVFVREAEAVELNL